MLFNKATVAVQLSVDLLSVTYSGFQILSNNPPFGLRSMMTSLNTRDISCKVVPIWLCSTWKFPSALAMIQCWRDPTNGPNPGREF